MRYPRAMPRECSQQPEKTGRGRMFISLDVDVLHSVRAELEGRGVAVRDGRWGYPLMVVHDPDGNELCFPYPADEGRSRRPVPSGGRSTRGTHVK